MDKKEEYHDPDYPEAGVRVKQEAPSLTDEEKEERIRAIVEREFKNEIDIKENEVMLADQRMAAARRMLHRLRSVLVSRYYRDQRLQHPDEPETSSGGCSGQRRLHPSVRKLLGKTTADMAEIFRPLATRHKRRDYSAMVQSRNYTIAADDTGSLRPEDSDPGPEPDVRPTKMPRHIEPKIENVLTLDEVTRNKMKHRYRIIIGNTSKYAPAASAMDRSTHKWLLYVRGVRQHDAARLLRAVVVTLHHSYAPHHVVHIDKPPYHISRRGWGEFPARVELHFRLPDRNRPASVTHTIKLDRHYTGLQTLGAETLVDVWLYSTPDMLECEYKEENESFPVQENTPEQENVQVKPDPDPDPDLKLPGYLNCLPGSDQNLPTDLNKCPLPSSNKKCLPGDLNKSLPGDLNKSLPGDLNKSLPGDLNKSLPGDLNKSLPGDLNKSLPGINLNKCLPEPEVPITPKQEPSPDDWLDFFTTETKLDVDEMFVKPQKKLDQIENHTDIDNNINHIDQISEEPVDVKPDILELENSIKTKDDKTNWTVTDKNIETPTETIPSEILNQPASPKKRIMKYLDPKTGKIYYLEMDRNLDLSKVQEIVINSKGNMKTAKLSPVKCNGVKKKKGVSLLKPEVKNLLSNKEKKIFTHIQNDHCYLGASWAKNINFTAPKTEAIKREKNLYEALCLAVNSFKCVRVAVNYLLRKIPIVTELARDPDFRTCFPFAVDSDERFWKMDFAKRRNKEWSRAKLINTILSEHLRCPEPIWRTKQILIFSRLHGYQPVRRDAPHTNDWLWDDPVPSDPATVSVFNADEFNTSVTDTVDVSDDEDVEVVGEVPSRVEPKREEAGALTVLPVLCEQDRLRFLFLERQCADIGVELRNEDVGNGCSYSAVHAVMLSALKSFVEELVRSAHAATRLEGHIQQPPTVWSGWSAGAVSVSPRAVAAALSRSRLAALTNRDCGAHTRTFDAI